MEEYFKNGYEGGTPIPKAMYWYAISTKYDGVLNADKCNELLNGRLKKFFEKYPQELFEPVLFTGFWGNTNITDNDIKFYKKEIGE